MKLIGIIGAGHIGKAAVNLAYKQLFKLKLVSIHTV
jgi:phosphoglycerate dehydrogenase-like enzyme